MPGTEEAAHTMDDRERRSLFEAEAVPHMDALYSSALSMTRNSATADDLIQETYLKAWRFWDKFEPGTSCKAWLFRIMTNTYINMYRKWSREPHKVGFEDIEGHSESKIASDAPIAMQPLLDVTEREAFDNLFTDEVKAAIESLPLYFRVVALLSDVQGFTYQEIADILDIPIGTVRSRLSRARSMLQEALRDYARERGLSGEPRNADAQEEESDYREA
jgi:RNA polymerase sigma-70 factor, ECF subfamily